VASGCRVFGVVGYRIWRVAMSRTADARVAAATGFEIGFQTSAGEQVGLLLADALPGSKTLSR
jgi:hypothetical protein